MFTLNYWGNAKMPLSCGWGKGVYVHLCSGPFVSFPPIFLPWGPSIQPRVPHWLPMKRVTRPRWNWGVNRGSETHQMDHEGGFLRSRHPVDMSSSALELMCFPIHVLLVEPGRERGNPLRETPSLGKMMMSTVDLVFSAFNCTREYVSFANALDRKAHLLPLILETDDC